MGCDIDPADFPESMAVQFPWRMNEPPTILPVIRMGGGAFIANRYDGQPGNYAGGRAARSADVIVCLLETVVYMDLCVMGWLLHSWSISC